ncbi:hypothetical protein EV176_006717, partial [Coemansia sp. RSA 451]
FYAMIPFGGILFLLSLGLKHIPLRTKMVKTHGNSQDEEGVSASDNKEEAKET